MNPCADPLVRELLARTRRAYAQRGHAPKRQRALTKHPLERLLATCEESLKGKRDRALLLFAWASGGRRRSEVASALLENLQRVNADAFVYTLTHSKTNQRGELRPEDVKPLVGKAAAAMREWLAVLQHWGSTREGSSGASAAAGTSASRWRQRRCANGANTRERAAMPFTQRGAMPMPIKHPTRPQQDSLAQCP